MSPSYFHRLLEPERGVEFLSKAPRAEDTLVNLTCTFPQRRSEPGIGDRMGQHAADFVRRVLTQHQT